MIFFTELIPKRKERQLSTVVQFLTEADWRRSS